MKKIFFLILLSGFIFLGCFLGVLETRAFLAPRIYVTDLKINEIKDNQIKGEFSVSNSEQYYLTDLNYEIKLFLGVLFEKFKLIDISVSGDKFFVTPNGTITKTFIYPYPKNIASGDYTVRAQIITDRGSELGWKDQKVSLKGENKFLDIVDSSSKVLYGGKEIFPSAGVNILPEENVIGFFKVKNLGNEVTVTPRIKIFQRQISMPLVKEYQEAQITFAKGETKDISLAMPKFSAPESYLAEVKFYKDNEQISGIRYFGWVVKGEGGKILYVKLDKDYYRAGEDVKIVIDLIGPADASDIGNGKLEVIVYDKDNNFVVKTIQDVVLNSDLVSLEITTPVTKDLIYPIINVRLIKGENILDDRNIKFPIFSEEAKGLEKEIANKEKNKIYLIYILSAVVFIIIITAIFLLYKFKINKNK